MLALYQVLSELGHDVMPAAPDKYPAFLNWMPQIKAVRLYDSSNDSADIQRFIQNADLHISLDYNALPRLGTDLENAVRAFTGQSLLIDHHRQPDQHFDYSFHSILASSTAELVYDFINHLTSGQPVSTDIAQCIYAGIVTDTGSFRFPSATPHTLRIVADLIEGGLQHARVYNHIFDTNSLDRLRLLGYVLAEKLVVIPEAQTAYIALSSSDLERYQHRPGDSEGFVNYALSVEGVRFACLLKEHDDEVKISLRSKGNLDVNSIARQYFNGGGHLNAAGGRLVLPLNKAVQTFLKIVEQNRDLFLSK